MRVKVISHKYRQRTVERKNFNTLNMPIGILCIDMFSDMYA